MRVAESMSQEQASILSATKEQLFRLRLVLVCMTVDSERCSCEFLVLDTSRYLSGGSEHDELQLLFLLQQVPRLLLLLLLLLVLLGGKVTRPTTGGGRFVASCRHNFGVNSFD